SRTRARPYRAPQRRPTRHTAATPRPRERRGRVARTYERLARRAVKLRGWPPSDYGIGVDSRSSDASRSARSWSYARAATAIPKTVVTEPSATLTIVTAIVASPGDPA